MCESVALLGEPIALDPQPPNPSHPAAAPVLWRSSTQELVIARPDPGNLGACNMSIQTRDIDGVLLDEPISPLLHDYFYCNDNAALAWNENLGRYLFVGQGGAGNNYFLVLESFDEQGVSQWSETGPYVCNNYMQSLGVRAVGDAFYVMGSEHHCAFPDQPRNIYVDAWGPDGVQIGHVQTGYAHYGGHYGGAECLGPDCLEAYSVRAGGNPPGDLINGVSGTWGQRFDLANFTADSDDLSLNLGGSNLQHGGVGSNGTQYLVATAHYVNQNSMSYRFRLVEPDGSLVPGGLMIGHARRPSPFDILWTGDGWLIASAVWAYTGSGVASNWTDYQIRIWHLAPDTSLRETFILDDPNPGLMPKLALMPGKVAITWVRPGVDRSRMLGLLGC